MCGIGETKTGVGTFSFQMVNDEPLETDGTTVSVTDLHAGVKAEFALERFHSELSAAIRDAHIDSLEAGLSITYNGKPLLHETAGTARILRLRAGVLLKVDQTVPPRMPW